MTTKEFFKLIGIPERKEEKEVKMLDPEVIKRINSGIESRLCENPDGTVYQEVELKDWQWEIMLRNESEGEDFT